MSKIYSTSTATALNAASGDEDDTLAFIIQVKEEVQRCLEEGMNKEEMFRGLREKGSHPAATFAVYKELRHQNNDFFKEYYIKMDWKKHVKRLNFLLHKYQTMRVGGVHTRPPGTATVHPNDVGLPENSALLVGLESNSQSAVASAQLLSSLMHVPNGGVQEVIVPSGACITSSDAMGVSCPWACDNVETMGWHDEQAAQVPGAGANVVPPQGSYWLPRSSGEWPLESGSQQLQAEVLNHPG